MPTLSPSIVTRMSASTLRPDSTSYCASSRNERWRASISNRTFLPLVACYLFHSAVFAPIMMAFLFEFFADQVLGLGRGALRGRVAPEPSRTGPPAAVLELHVYLFKFPIGF